MTAAVVMASSVLAAVLVIALIREIRLRRALQTREQAARQAEQSRQMVEMQKAIMDGSRKLVEADAESRRELILLQHDLQADQHEIGRQRDLASRLLFHPRESRQSCLPFFFTFSSPSCPLNSISIHQSSMPAVPAQ